MQNLELLKQLVRFRSTHDRPQDIRACLDIIKDYFKETSLPIQEFKSEGRISLLIGPKTSDVLLMGHVDVVPAEDHQFEPAQVGNILYGRGVSDMKGLVVVMMEVLREQSDIVRKGKPRISLLITSDEEHGGLHGAGHMFRQEKLRCKLAIIPDGGDDFELIKEEKGVMKLSITASGKAAHASRPWEGKNPILALAAFQCALEDVLPLPVAMNDWRTSMVWTQTRAGEMANQIPKIATATYDVRYIGSSKTALTLIKRVARQCGVSVTPDAIFPSIQCRTTAPSVRAWKRLVETRLKKAIPEIRYAGSCDAKYVSEQGIPCIITKPRGGDIHGPKEWIDLKSLQVYQDLLREYLQAWKA